MMCSPVITVPNSPTRLALPPGLPPQPRNFNQGGDPDRFSPMCVSPQLLHPNNARINTPDLMMVDSCPSPPLAASTSYIPNKLPVFIPPGLFDCSSFVCNLGHGAFGSVFKCNLRIHTPVSECSNSDCPKSPHTHCSIPISCAIKQMLLFHFNPYNEVSVSSMVVLSGKEHRVPHCNPSVKYPIESEPLREVALASSMRDPVVRMYHVSVSHSGILYAAMDPATNNLLTVAASLGQQSADKIMLYATQMLTCVAYLHSMGVAHGDVKLSNFLLFPGDIIKLGDLGMSCSLLMQPLRQRSLMYTADYRPPEFCLPLMYNVCELMRGDVWACGASIYALCTGGDPPAGILNADEDIFSLSQLTKVMMCFGIPTELYWPKNVMPEDARTLRKICATKAKSMGAGLYSPFSAGAPVWKFYSSKTARTRLPEELLQSLQQIMQYDSLARPTARKCLNAPIFLPYGKHIYPILQCALQQKNSAGQKSPGRLSPDKMPAAATAASRCLAHNLPGPAPTEIGNMWIFVLFDILKKVTTTQACFFLNTAAQNEFGRFMFEAASSLRRLRKELDDAVFRLHANKHKKRSKTQQNRRFGNCGISEIDKSVYPRSGFSEFAESIGVCLYYVLRRVHIEFSCTHTIPGVEEAAEYGLSAFIVYDALRHGRQYGVAKYMATPTFVSLVKNKFDVKNRAEAQKYLGKCAFTTVTTLNFDFATPTPWDIATLLLRFICELVGAEGSAVYCGYCAVVLRHIEFLLSDITYVASYNALELGSWLADLSIRAYSHDVPEKGARILSSVLDRMKKELPVHSQLMNKQLI